jgi:hypothetical protein
MEVKPSSTKDDSSFFPEESSKEKTHDISAINKSRFGLIDGVPLSFNVEYVLTLSHKCVFCAQKIIKIDIDQNNIVNVDEFGLCHKTCINECGVKFYHTRKNDLESPAFIFRSKSNYKWRELIHGKVYYHAADKLFMQCREIVNKNNIVFGSGHFNFCMASHISEQVVYDFKKIKLFLKF